MRSRLDDVFTLPIIKSGSALKIDSRFCLLYTSYSFPSGHSAASFAAVSAMYFTKCSLWKPVVFVAAAIAFSRLYLYVHFPTDVAAGILLGILSGLAAAKIYKRLFLKNREINF